jgi:hypothetical protein
MAAEYRHPYPIDGALPLLRTQHEARDFLAQYQQRGFIRRCAYARVRQTGGVAGGAGEGYLIHCDQHSFQIVDWSEYGPDVERAGFQGGPKGCLLYQPRWRGTLRRVRARFHPLIWFDRQPWQVKVAIILLPSSRWPSTST